MHVKRCPGAKQIGEAVLCNHTFIIDERGPAGGYASVKRQKVLKLEEFLVDPK